MIAAKDAENAELAKNLKMKEIAEIISSSVIKTTILSISATTQQRIDSIQIPDEMLGTIVSIVRTFKQHGNNIVERSYSICEQNSVHFLWKQIFVTIQDFFRKELQQRIVYEWKIHNPVKESECKNNSIDFAFLPVGNQYANWHSYGGGIEVKITAGQINSSSSSITGSSLTPTPDSSRRESSVANGERQALSRAAMCVYDRWNKAEKKGSFRSYCCYANSRRLGLARVALDGDTLQLTSDVLPMMYLTGVRDGIKEDINSLRLLTFLLTSDNESLSEFITPPNPNPTQIVGSGGVCSGGGGSVDSQIIWNLGVYLGAGSSAAVYRDLEHPTCVIKIPHDITKRKSVDNEREILDVLRENNVRFVPQAEDQLENCLKLSPLGIPVSTYLQLASKLPDDLIRFMGPVLVDTLQHVHRLGIAHLDIRRQNILIVPPADNQNDYISLMHELSGVEKVLGEIKLADCSFYLNDWGAAKRTKVEEKYREDLKMLLDTLLKEPVNDDYSSSRSRSSKKKEKSHEHASGGGGGDDDSDTTRAYECASLLNYAGMRSFLSNFGT